MVRPEIKWPDHLWGSRFHSNPVGGVERQSEEAESDCLSFLPLSVSFHTYRRYTKQLMSRSVVSVKNVTLPFHFKWSHFVILLVYLNLHLLSVWYRLKKAIYLDSPHQCTSTLNRSVSLFFSVRCVRKYLTKAEGNMGERWEWVGCTERESCRPLAADQRTWWRKTHWADRDTQTHTHRHSAGICRAGRATIPHSYPCRLINRQQSVSSPFHNG